MFLLLHRLKSYLVQSIISGVKTKLQYMVIYMVYILYMYLMMYFGENINKIATCTNIFAIFSKSNDQHRGIKNIQ